MELLNNLFNQFINIFNDIRILKNLSLESDKMVEYNLCNVARVDIVILRKKLFDMLIDFLEDKKDDFSFVVKQSQNIIAIIEELALPLDVKRAKTLCGLLKRVASTTSDLVDQIPNLTLSEKRQMQNQIIIFQYSTLY